MQREGKLSNFIQENRAPVRQFEFPQLAGVRSGKGAALMSEQLIFHQVFGDGGTVQRQPWARPARGLS